MRKERVCEVLCLVALVAFVFVPISQNIHTTNPLGKISGIIFDETKIEELDKKSASDFYKEFNLSADDYEEVIYRAADTVMNVKEVLLVELKDNSQREEVENAIISRVKDKISLFKNYAPEEAELLEDYVLEFKHGVVLFAVTDKPDEVITSFRSIV